MSRSESSKAPKRSKSQPVVAAAVVVPGENLQSTADHGEHLRQFPTLSVVFDVVEMGLTLLGLVFALVATGAHFGVSYMILINGILILLLLGVLTFAQWTSMHVIQEVNLYERPRLLINPTARRYLAAIHLLRLALLGSTISTLVYFGACGDAKDANQPGICKLRSSSAAFLFVASTLLLIQFVLVLLHLVFYFKNRMAVRRWK